MVCRRYTRAYLRHLMHSGEALSATLNSIHNLAYYLGLMQRVRNGLEPDPQKQISTAPAVKAP
jgi:queuine tRNA-ribosyltransferase